MKCKIEIRTEDSPIVRNGAVEAHCSCMIQWFLPKRLFLLLFRDMSFPKTVHFKSCTYFLR